LGGTRVSRVISGVTPEIVEARTMLQVRSSIHDLRHPTKFGATPNLTGVTPVPPFILTAICAGNAES
jgi:hypothetical protein